MSTKRKAFVISNFNDAGTEKNFKAGSTIELTEGEFTNYAAPGLVREPDATDKAKLPA